MGALTSSFSANAYTSALAGLFRRPEPSDNIALVPREQQDSKPKYTYDMQNGINGCANHESGNRQDVETPNGGAEARPGEGTSNVWQAGWNVGNCMQGIGILSLPYTVKEGGTAALATMAVVLLIGNYTSKLLVRCMYDEEEYTESLDDGQERTMVRRRKARSTYADIAEACFSGGGKLLNIMQLIDMVAVATLYLELAGSLLVDTFPFNISKLAWMVICAIFLVPTVFFKTLTNISWLSLVALLSLILMFSSVVIYSVDNTVKWDISSMPGFRVESFSLSSSIILFNFGCQFLVPSVEESLEDKSKFDVMVNWTYFITGVLNLSYAFFAFLTFGEGTYEFITYNMDVGFLQSSLSLLFVIKSLLSYPLMIFLIVNTVDALHLSCIPSCYPAREGDAPSVWAYLFRVVLVAFTLLLAVVVPYFTLLMGFTGSLTAPWLDFIFPCLFHMKLNQHKLGWFSLSAHWGVVFVGVIGGVVGLVYSTIFLVEEICSDIFS